MEEKRRRAQAELDKLNKKYGNTGAKSTNKNKKKNKKKKTKKKKKRGSKKDEL